jgi:hypothetical protein
MILLILSLIFGYGGLLVGHPPGKFAWFGANQA